MEGSVSPLPTPSPSPGRETWRMATWQSGHHPGPVTLRRRLSGTACRGLWEDIWDLINCAGVLMDNAKGVRRDTRISTAGTGQTLRRTLFFFYAAIDINFHEEGRTMMIIENLDRWDVTAQYLCVHVCFAFDIWGGRRHLASMERRHFWFSAWSLTMLLIPIVSIKLQFLWATFFQRLREMFEAANGHIRL